MQIYFLFFPLWIFASPEPLTEKSLVELAGSSSPRLSEIRAQLLRSMTDKNLLTEKYAPELYARGSYSETQERPVIEFLPVFSPIKTGFVGVKQKFSKGFEAKMQLTTDQRSANSSLSGQYRDVTTNILSLTVQMDLWKNLLGTLSQAELERSELSSKSAKIEEEINKKALTFSIRRLFWSLVANAEQIKIANRLLTDAKNQLKDAGRRLSKSVSDAGDVARYEALLAQRKGQLIFLNYQKELLTKSLKTLIPELNGKEFQVSGYDVERTIEEVKECASTIVTSPSVPWNYTRYDEIILYLKEVKNLNNTINGHYSDVDVKLFGSLRSTGVGSDKLNTSSYRGSYGRAFEDMQNNNRSGYEVGVNLTIPLGEAKGETKKTKTLYDEERLYAQIKSYDAQISSTHSELAKSLALIADVIETQKMSTSALQKRVTIQRQKFDQARVSTSELLLDQEALLNSEISTIDSQLQALNVLIDYLMIFTDTPCAFNRM
jgi:hypothetical protein